VEDVDEGVEGEVAAVQGVPAGLVPQVGPAAHRQAAMRAGGDLPSMHGRTQKTQPQRWCLSV